MESEKHLCLLSAHACCGRGGSRGRVCAQLAWRLVHQPLCSGGARLFWGSLFFPAPHEFPGVLLLALRPAASPRAGCRAGDTALSLSLCGVGGRVPAAAPTSCPIAGFGWTRAGGHGAAPLVQDQMSVFETRLTCFGYFYLLPHSPGLA